MHTTSGYQAGSRGPGLSYSGTEQDSSEYWTLDRCKRAYSAYLDSKRLEIDEQQQARRYRHCVQWNADQIKVLNDRKQPIVTYNRIGRKIDGIVGLVEKLRQDPKAYPRTPQHQQGADLATAALRFVMDEEDWKSKTPIISEIAAVDGIGGIELSLEASDQTREGADPNQPDMDPEFGIADIENFFYDPRSFKHDFSDARYMGMGKWLDEDQLLDMYPDLEEEISVSLDRGSELTSNSDKDNRWFMDMRDFRQVRVVEIWYKHKGKWCWCQFTGQMKLKEGQSPFVDEEGQQFCKYIMFSAAVDHEGDRYGFPRNLYSAQDEINQRRSKALHLVNSRKIRATQAAVQNNDVERLRREAARPDGIVLSNTSIDDIQFDDAATQAALMGQLEFLKDAKAEIENFGPNPAVVGDAGIQARSGRAIAMLQQAGIAELGPYMTNLRGWKIRVYRALFNIVQMYWTNERWIRVTDDQGLAQFVQINALQIDPMTGRPTIANQIGELDVDIILDEGPDTITIMQDTYEAIAQALPSVAPMLSPAKAAAVLEVLIETSPLPADVKKKFRDAGEAEQGQPNPEQQKGMMELQLKQQDQQLEAQKAAAGIQQKREEGQVKLQIAREEAQNDIAVEWAKARNAVKIEQFKAANQARNEHIQTMANAQATMNGPSVV
jgi:hypothetical protein